MEEEEAADAEPEMALWPEVGASMIKTPPNRPGITFEVGARLEAQDYLLKWYPSKIEKIDYEQEKMLIHFERWSSRYDEWIHWDSTRLRPLERPSLRKEGLKEEEENYDFKEGDEVLARWTDCRYYPAKIETINKEGTYTVQFYDGVIRCLKKMHIKYMPEDAKGQDWIALVKVAAAAAAKTKPAGKPRTSANSNKDKEEKRHSKGPVKKEEPVFSNPTDVIQKEEEKPTSSRTLDIAVDDVPKTPVQQPDDELLLKRKISEATSFQAKRARLNKITGLLASKAVELEDAEKKEHPAETTSRLEEAISPKPQSQKQIEGGVCRSGITSKSSSLSSALSPSGKARRKKDRRDPEDVSGCKKSPLPHISADLTQGTPPPADFSRSTGRNNRRSSRRQSVPVPESASIPMRDGKALQSYASPPRDLTLSTVPDVAYVPSEKNEPLDLSRSAELTSPVVPEPSCRIECPRREAENIQITCLSRAVEEDKVDSTSTAPMAPVHVSPVEMVSPKSIKPAKASKKKKPAVSLSSESVPPVTPVLGTERLPDNLHEKIIKKVSEKDKNSDLGIVKSEKKVKEEDKPVALVKKKEKEKDRKEKKEKDHVKSKKKKKKKKKIKLNEGSDVEDGPLDALDRSTSPLSCLLSSTLPLRNPLTVKNTSSSFPRAILSVDLTGENFSEMDVLDDSSTESLILSDDEYNQDFDSTIFEESQDEEEAINEIVRCICEMDEENGFMIQCEECLCWQHSVCMGLLEDSIPEQYICYICNNPPGQRWSAKYKYDKDWFNHGRLCGLSFVNENYSYINAKKIVSTHHLLADIYRVTEILHGLQLKIGILKNKEHPDLRLWGCPGTRRESGHHLNDKRPPAACAVVNSCIQNRKGLFPALQKLGDTYITSEHSYQKPQGSGHGLKSSNDLTNSDWKDGVHQERERPECHVNTKKSLPDSLRTEQVMEQNSAEENSVHGRHEKKGTEEQLDSHLQWQLNLLTHIESVQNDVSNRMDLIEKEVDVLESWMDFTGDLEPPDPLARMPQLKRRIKQLLTDMNKVQQMATMCSV